MRLQLLLTCNFLKIARATEAVVCLQVIIAANFTVLHA